jgi:DNA-directed RNA polymerase specialized sigma24 family protein
MLTWLSPDRDFAAIKYEQIRSKLISRFRQRGCSDPEELANETFDRVACKLPRIIDVYVGDREAYVFAIAHYIYREHTRRPIITSLLNTDHLPVTSDDEVFGREFLDFCLQQCMEKLDATSREMIVEYYRDDRKAKIKSRQKLAERMGISLNNLRLKALRIRMALKKCILDCMEREAAEREVVM